MYSEVAKEFRKKSGGLNLDSWGDFQLSGWLGIPSVRDLGGILSNIYIIKYDLCGAGGRMGDSVMQTFHHSSLSIMIYRSSFTPHIDTETLSYPISLRNLGVFQYVQRIGVIPMSLCNPNYFYIFIDPLVTPISSLSPGVIPIS